jgi:hypothetical protein
VVAGFDAATNDNVTVYAGGVQHATASGTVTAGDVVSAAAAGTVATSATAPVGIALSTATTGNDVRVQFNR